MTEPMIDQTEEAVAQDLIEELSDEALDRTEGARLSVNYCPNF